MTADRHGISLLCFTCTVLELTNWVVTTNSLQITTCHHGHPRLILQLSLAGTLDLACPNSEFTAAGHCCVQADDMWQQFA